MVEEKDKFLETIRRWEDRILSVFKLIALTFALIALLILQFDDIERALQIKAEAVSVQREQSTRHLGDENQPITPVLRKSAPIHRSPGKQRGLRHNPVRKSQPQVCRGPQTISAAGGH
jgi:hypothetical protein